MHRFSNLTFHLMQKTNESRGWLQEIPLQTPRYLEFLHSATTESMFPTLSQICCSITQQVAVQLLTFPNFSLLQASLDLFLPLLIQTNTALSLSEDFVLEILRKTMVSLLLHI